MLAAVVCAELASALAALLAPGAAPLSWFPAPGATTCARALVCAPMAMFATALAGEPGVLSVTLLAIMTVATGVAAVAASDDWLAAVVAPDALPSA